MDLLHIEAAVRFPSHNVKSNSGAAARRHLALFLCQAYQAGPCSQPGHNLGENLEAFMYKSWTPPPVSLSFTADLYSYHFPWRLFGFGQIAFIISCQWEDSAVRSHTLCSDYP